jgi:hypothetical protein
MTKQRLKRRKALIQIALGVLASLWAWVSCAPFGRREVRSSNETAQLRSELAKLDRPPDWEEGVPVLLFGEDLAAPRGEVQRASGDGPKLAAEFRLLAEVFLETHSTATRSDISKLVEWLALRDFGADANP